MKNKLTSALLCLLFAGCTTTAPVDSENSDENGSSASSTASAAAMEATAFSGQNTEIDDENSTITFIGGSSIIDHNGKFTKFNAVLVPDQATPGDLSLAQLDISIDMTSAVTDSEGLDGHLQKTDFFDAENYPEATFSSTQIVDLGDNMFDIVGDFTLKGTTKQVTISAEVTDMYIKGSFDIPRQEFGVGNDSYGDKLLDENVPVTATFMFESKMMDEDEDKMMEEGEAMEGEDDSMMQDAE